MTLEQKAASFGGKVWGTLSTPTLAGSRLPLPRVHSRAQRGRQLLPLFSRLPSESLVNPGKFNHSATSLGAHWACSVAGPGSGGQRLPWAQGSGRRPPGLGFPERGLSAAAPEPGARRAPPSPPGRWPLAPAERRRSGPREPPTSRQFPSRFRGEPCK